MQGIGVALGLQDKFSWASVAVAGVIGGVGHAVGNAIPGAAGSQYVNAAGETITRTSATFANSLISGMAGGIAGAASRSLVEGSNFGDNLMAALPDIIGQTIGEAIAGGISGEIEEARARRAEQEQMALSSSPVESVIEAAEALYGGEWALGDVPGDARLTDVLRDLQAERRSEFTAGTVRRRFDNCSLEGAGLFISVRSHNPFSLRLLTEGQEMIDPMSKICSLW